MRRLTARLMIAALSIAAACAPAPSVPRDRGPVVIAPTPPPPIRGGGLLMLDHVLVVSDAEHDRIVLFDPSTDQIGAQIPLPSGSEPGRAAATGDHLVHVVLRGRGSVLTFDRATPNATLEVPVCPTPVGIATDPSVTGLVFVACDDGRLVTLDHDGATISTTIVVARDLRDVIATQGRLFVTTFRAAELREVDPQSGAVLSTTTPADAMYVERGLAVLFHASVAWRAVLLGSDLIVMLHQRMRTSSISVRPAAAPTDGSFVDGGMQVLRGAYDQTQDAPDAGVAGADECAAIVRSGIAFFDVSSGVRRTSLSSASLTAARLAVDVAAWQGAGPEELSIALANAGVGDGGGGVAFAAAGRDVGIGLGPCVSSDRDASVDAHATVAVAFDAAGDVIALERDPIAILHHGSRFPLGGASTFDTGHAIFHTATTARIACASCHPEGREDGQLWTFDFDGRRTQSLTGGLLATAPFHWDGQESSVHEILDDVLTRRMSGPSLDDEHVAAVTAWLDQLPAPMGRVESVDSAARGRVLFYGAAGCGVCHAGLRFTNNMTMSIGIGPAAQVPSLVGVGSRLPLMRSGCARTIEQRFDPACGGTAHGSTNLSTSDIADLVQYLESL